jgi:CRISPR-associated endonuclease/helicase Cas3
MTALAKPTGITLADHTRHVRDEMRAVLAARPFLVYKYAVRTGQNLLVLADACARWHDEGKQHPSWQKACQVDFAEYTRLGKPRNFKAGNLLRADLRHELDSLVRMRSAKEAGWLPPAAFAAVAAHHGKLSKRHEHRWKKENGFLRFWKEEFLPLSGELQHTNAESFEQAIARRYEYSGLRALLRLADRRASAREDADASNRSVVPELKRFQYNFPYKEQRGIQALIPQLWDEPFALLRAPTGAGKTDAALLWARRQVLRGRADRLVWAMPTRFTANSLAISTTESLGHTGLYHSSAWYQAQQKAQGQSGWRQELDYARLLETAATVTTIDQLCLSLTATREDHHATFWNLAHSCVVIDEVDFYDEFTQWNLVVLLRALHNLQVPVLLMSATLPQSAIERYRKSGFQPSKIFETVEPADEHPRLNLHRVGLVEFPSDVESLLQRAVDGEPMIIYANTVGRAQAYWDWFNGKAVERVLYHSRYTEPDKMTIETRLKDMLGPDAWKYGKAKGIAILTQIGELSVNISADLMISDLCPTDRLAQRAGRLSRFKDRADGKSELMGELFLAEPYKTTKDGERKIYPAPYGHYTKGKGWEQTAVLEESGHQFIEGEYSARRFVDLVNQLYPAVPNPETSVRNNYEELEKLLIENWLIIPRVETETDDEETKEWKSRDIAPQKTVYANTDFSAFVGEGDPTYFPTSFSFKEWALPRAISIAVYDFDRAWKDGKITSRQIIVGDEPQTIWTVEPPYYSSTVGLRFDRAPSEEDE